jgi:CheY-like chemotaxis protein
LYICPDIPFSLVIHFAGEQSEMAKEVKVLLVDEEAGKIGDSIQEMLNLLAPHSGLYNFRCCANFQQALSLLEEADIVLVGVDLTIEYMPERFKDFLPQVEEENAGYRLIRHIKDEYPGIKTIVLATFSGCKDAPPGEEAVAREKGASGFIVKPFRAMELVDAIRSV